VVVTWRLLCAFAHVLRRFGEGAEAFRRPQRFLGGLDDFSDIFFHGMRFIF
jgi:hypothetical protein